jgi:hypothetical protein|tara:strand:+ start:1146 stop:1511 length:366 start_codon:yes stop_codon:yes gene_type:complete
MGKIVEIEWIEDDSVEGDEKKLTVNFKKGLLITWNGRELPLDDNKTDVLWVIENNITDKTERMVKAQSKINITEVTRIPIKNGYKLLEPLNEQQMEKFVDRVGVLLDEITQLNTLKEIYTD